MEVVTEMVGDVCVATVPLETVESANAGELKRQLLAALQGRSKVVLDMHHVQFVDSMGCGVILSCFRNLSPVDLKLCSLNAAVRAVIELIRLHRIVEIHETRESAIASFSASKS